MAKFYSVLEESDAAQPEDVCSVLFCLGDLEILAGAHGKEECDNGELNYCYLYWCHLELVHFF